MNTQVVAGSAQLAGAGGAVSASRTAGVSQGSPERASRQVRCHRNSRPPSVVSPRRDTGLPEFLDVRDSAVHRERSPHGVLDGCCSACVQAGSGWSRGHAGPRVAGNIVGVSAVTCGTVGAR